MRKKERKPKHIRRSAAMALAVLMGIGSMFQPIETYASLKDATEVTDLLDELNFTPDASNIKVSSEHPDYPGTDALRGDGIHYWKNGSTEVYKTVYEPSALFWAVDLGEEKTVESAYIVLANEAKYLNLTLDKVNAKNLVNKFEIVYTSDEKLWEELPEPSDEVCEYSWENAGWKLAGGTETEGLWSNTQLNGKDWACDTKTFHHPFTARYVMVYIHLVGEANLPENSDLGLAELKLFGYDAIENEVEILPEKTEFFRSIASDVSTEFPTEETISSVSHLTITRALEKGTDSSTKNPGKMTKLRKGTDYEILGSRLVLNQDYLMTLPPADNQFLIRFKSGAEAYFTVSVSSKSDTLSIINSVPGTSPFTVLGEALGTDEPVEGSTKRIRAALPAAESHVINLFDEELGKYVMSLQAHDSDCRIGCYAHKANYNQATGELIDGDNSRQRIEIRPSTDSGMDQVAVEEDVTKYTWKWRLADDYPVSGSFNHIFQMKAVNGQRKGTLPGFDNPVQEHGKAIFSFTAVNKGLQFRYNDKVVVDQNQKEVSIPMDQVRGRWIDVSLEMLHSDNGWAKVRISDSETGEVLMDYAGAHDTWRRPEQNGVGELDYPACYDQYNRPKWGIYRKGTRDGGTLRASHIEFCDLTLTKNADEAETYITDIALTKPNKLHYIVGEELDLTGMTVTATDSNAKKRELEESEYEVSGFDSSEAGESVVSVAVTTTVGEKSYELVKRFTVEVAEETYYTDKIYVAEKPKKTDYYVDDTLETDGMAVKVVRKASSSNASYEEVLAEDAYEVDYDFSKAGKTPVTVTYHDFDKTGAEKAFEDSFTVTVKKKPEEPIPAPADKTELKNLVDTCDEITNENYTMESWNAYLKALQAAKEVLAKENADEKEIQKALDGLYQAMEELTEKPPVVPTPEPGTSSGSSSSGRRARAASVSIAKGTWKLDTNGWWYENPDGSFPKNQWSKLEWNGVSSWYCFDQNGYMLTGWLDWNGNRYYLHPISDNTKGHMYTGWHEIDGKWYFFHTEATGIEGALCTGGATPDGYQVDANGVWIP